MTPCQTPGNLAHATESGSTDVPFIEMYHKVFFQDKIPGVAITLIQI